MTSTRDALDTLIIAATDFADKIEEVIDGLDAAEAHTPAPKVGDRVRITEGFVGGPTSSVVGSVGTVTEIDHDYSGTGRTCYIVDGKTAAAVEVIDPAPETVKVGDLVKVVRTESTIASWREGQEGTVKSFEFGKPVVQFDDGGRVRASVTSPVKPKAPEPASKSLDIASKNWDRRIEIKPSPYVCAPGGVEINLVESSRSGGQGARVFAFFNPEQMRQVIATLQANLDGASA